MSRNNRTFTYDFFLLSDENNDKDTQVANKIKEYLEREHHLKGYLEHQDGLAGRSVFGNFENALLGSHYVILLISSESINDGWWKNQMESSLFHHLTKMSQENIIPIYLPNLNLDLLPPSLSIYTGVNYDDNASSNFWKRLARVFNH
jgi:hypothetical protein